MMKRKAAVLFAGAMVLICCDVVKSEPRKTDKKDGMLVEIVFSPEWKTLTPEMYGVNTQTLAGPKWNNNPVFMKRIRGLNFGNMRYPGGTIGNYFDWRTGTFMECDMRDPARGPIHTNMKGDNIYRLEEFKKGIEASGAEPIYMVNMLTDTLESTLEMLAHARSLGLPVKYVELGNEFYMSYTQGGNAREGKLGDYANVAHHYPTAESYALEAVKWIDAIKKIYPEAIVAFIGTEDRSDEYWFNSSPRTMEWNRVMREKITNTDRVTIHGYPNVDGCSPLAALHKTLGEFREARTHIDREFGNYKVWYTEYNNKTDNNAKGKRRNAYAGMWIHGIITSLSTVTLMNIPQIELTCIHDISAGITAALIYSYDTKIPVAPNASQTVTAPLHAYSASGMTHEILSRVIRGAERMQLLGVTNCPMLECERGEVAAVQGAVFDDGKVCKAFVVNVSDRDVVFSCEGLDNTTTIEQNFTASLTAPITGETSYTRRTRKIGSDRVVKLAPYSVSVIY